MNDDYFDNNSIDPELQVRLMNLLMGEASDFERDQLQSIMAHRVEIAEYYQQLERIHGLLCTVGDGELSIADDSKDTEERWQLSANRRAELMSVLNGETGGIRTCSSENSSWRLFSRTDRYPWLATAALVVAACVLIRFSLLSIQATKPVAKLFQGNFTDQAKPLGMRHLPQVSNSFFDSENSPKTQDRYLLQEGQSLHDKQRSMGFDVGQPAGPGATDPASNVYFARPAKEFGSESPQVVGGRTHASDFDSRGIVQKNATSTRGDESLLADLPSKPTANDWVEAKSNLLYAKPNGEPAFDLQSDKPNISLGSITNLRSQFELATPATDESVGSSRNSANIPSQANDAPSVGKGLEKGYSFAVPNDSMPSAIRLNDADVIPRRSGQESENLSKRETPSLLVEGEVESRLSKQNSTQEYKFRYRNTEEAEGKSPKLHERQESLWEFETENRFGKSNRVDEVDFRSTLRGRESAATSNIAGKTILNANDELHEELARGSEAEISETLRKSVNQTAEFGLEANIQTTPSVESKIRDDYGNQSRLQSVQKTKSIGEQLATADAFSTFSLHVSDVSFRLAQAALHQGQWPEASKIRIEEFVNAFDYHDPLPDEKQKVACQIEQAIHPILLQRNLMRISMRTAAAGRSQNTALRLTLLLDNSGSMERPDRREVVLRAFQSLLSQLTATDQITLISFANTPRLLAEKVPGNEGQKLLQLVENLPSEGGTNIEAALMLAGEKATEQQLAGAQNRIVLMTDGAVNLGNADPASLSQMVVRLRDRGIAFDAAGVCALDLNDEVLEALTRQGDGRYYLLDSAEAASESFASQIAGALRPSAQNVKVQVEFNPQRVDRYKLLGFEKHLLDKNDFRNDQVDAAEMAAAEAGVAIYQLQVKPQGSGDVGNVSVRFRDVSTGLMVERNWPIPYEPTPARIEHAKPSMQLAAIAALFAAKLGGGPLADGIELANLEKMMSRLSEPCFYQPRVQQLREMIARAKAIVPK